MSGCACKKLAARREELVTQSMHQREELLMQMQTLRESATPSRLGANLLATFQQNKWAIGGAALAVAVIKPRRIVAGLKAGLVGLQLWRRVGPALVHLFRRD